MVPAVEATQPPQSLQREGMLNGGIASGLVRLVEVVVGEC